METAKGAETPLTEALSDVSFGFDLLAEVIWCLEVVVRVGAL